MSLTSLQSSAERQAVVLVWCSDYYLQILHKQLGSLDEVSQCAYVLAISCDYYDT